MFRRKYLGTTAMTAVALSLAALYGGAYADNPQAAQTGEDGVDNSVIFPAYPLEPNGRDETVTVSVTNQEAAQRTYTISTTMDLRDDAEKRRVFTEDAAHPLLRSGNLMFDGLFAMAMDDLKMLSVSEIRDGSYNAGEPIACNCFQTGEKWTYVWTRDLSYAARLGLAELNPAQVINSLRFKTSDFREGAQSPASLPEGTLQIVQDTGSGGSWPVSTDRVTWALAAESVLNSLSGEAYDKFSDYAYAALRGTIEADRQAAFDQALGLFADAGHGPVTKHDAPMVPRTAQLTQTTHARPAIAINLSRINRMAANAHGPSIGPSVAEILASHASGTGSPTKTAARVADACPIWLNIGLFLLRKSRL